MKVTFPQLTEEELKERLTIPTGKIRLVLDTDAKNEIDDQFAVAWALRSKDRFNVEAVYAAPYSMDCIMRLMSGGKKQTDDAPDSIGGFENITYANDPGDGMLGSYNELLKLFELCGENSDGRVFKGSNLYLTDNGGPVESDAAKDLINRANASDELLYVAAFGAPTNIASALLMEPELVKKIVVVWLGGEPLYYGHGTDFNMMQDIQASKIMLDSGVPLIMIPVMNVVSHLTITKSEVEEYLIGKTDISDYLGKSVLAGFTDLQAAATQAVFMRMLYMRGRDDRSEEYFAQFVPTGVAWSRIICDIATVACLKNPGWVLTTLEEAPILNNDLGYGKSEEKRHLIRVANYCNRDLIFGDIIKSLTE